MKCIVTHNITDGDKYVTTRYELTNHLGNVMAVISDAPGGGTQPTVESLTDYYPFGMAMPVRSYYYSLIKLIINILLNNSTRFF